ncbi:hypothetical protein HMPREF0208_00439 [Citrobacter koseri]|nr:hypothetical protein HMPREF3220_01252 [Citrobacter koseri]KXA06179.1 hypothetical protein HMPREF3207_00327 [Citrobacter koseri]KXB46972.1 hypothetical protein HMPREF0208_00439 [Citrobacter koseri]
MSKFNTLRTPLPVKDAEARLTAGFLAIKKSRPCDRDSSNNVTA